MSNITKKTTTKEEETKTKAKASVKEKVVTKPELNIEEFVAKAVANALALKEIELNEKIETLKKETQDNSNITIKKSKTKRKFIPDTTMVRIEQGIGGKFLISDNRGQNFFIELNGFKDSTTMSYKDLKNFYGRSHTFFTSCKLIIVDVVSENEDITFEDVIYDLSLQRIYFDEKKINPLEIEDYFLDEFSTSEFENKLQNSMEIIETMLEVGYVMYRQGRFGNNAKMNIFRQILRNPSLFTKV